MRTNDGSNGNGNGVLKPRADWITRRKSEAARTGDNNMLAVWLDTPVGSSRLYLL